MFRNSEKVILRVKGIFNKKKNVDETYPYYCLLQNPKVFFILTEVVFFLKHYCFGVVADIYLIH